MNRYTLAILLSMFILGSQAQPDLSAHNETPVVGEKLPDYLLKNIKQYRKKELSLGDHKGKWLLLDFWWVGCVGCLRHMPIANDWHRQLRDKMNIIVVALNSESSSGSGAETTFEKLRAQLDLNFAYCFDSVLSRKWGINSFPHIIIVDPTGTVKLMSNGSDINTSKLQLLMEGRPVDFKPQETAIAKATVPIDTTWKYSSKLQPWVSDDIVKKREYTEAVFRRKKEELLYLYKYAFFGKLFWDSPKDSMYATVWPNPVVEVADTTLFHPNYQTGEGLFSYTLYLPPKINSPEIIRESLKWDLHLLTGFTAEIETRPMLIWKLVALPGVEGKIKTKGGEKVHIQSPSYNGSVAGFSFRNAPIRILRDRIAHFLGDAQIPYLDETGITYNVDVTINAPMVDRTMVIRELNRNGLDLIQEKRMMKVLVIKDNGL